MKIERIEISYVCDICGKSAPMTCDGCKKDFCRAHVMREILPSGTKIWCEHCAKAHPKSIPMYLD